MKTLIATLIAAAALVGTQASADYDRVYTLSEMVAPIIEVSPTEGPQLVLVNVDDPLELINISVPQCGLLMLDFQEDYVLTSKFFIDAPFKGTTDIRTSAHGVQALWKERFSVDGGVALLFAQQESL